MLSLVERLCIGSTPASVSMSAWNNTMPFNIGTPCTRHLLSNTVNVTKSANTDSLALACAFPGGAYSAHCQIVEPLKFLSAHNPTAHDPFLAYSVDSGKLFLRKMLIGNFFEHP